MKRTSVPTAARWAATVGYSRAVRVGNVVHVAGTAAVGPDGAVAHPGDAYAQTRVCLQIIADALHQLGAATEHVVRTRMYVRNPADWEAVGRAHRDVFAAVLPVTTMIFVDFIDPAMLVEIEAEAIVA